MDCREVKAKQSEITSDSFLKQVIEEANKLFVDGITNSKCLQLGLTEEKATQFRSTECFSRIENDLLYNANQIPDSNLIASAGPLMYHGYPLVAEFMHTIFKFDVKHILALGTHFGTGSSSVHHDFHDYSSGEETASAFNSHFPTFTATVLIHAKRTSGKIRNEYNKTLRSFQFSGNFVESELNLKLIQMNHSTKKYVVTATKVNAAIYALSDMHPINFKKNEGEKEKELLWRFFHKSLTERVLVHCHAGLGRTGHVILTFEILKHYNEIFSSKDPIKIAKEIHKIVERIRTNRPGLILTEGQFKEAINNAHILYHYALEKKYIERNMPVYQSALANSKTKQDEHKESSKNEKLSTKDLLGKLFLELYDKDDPNVIDAFVKTYKEDIKKAFGTIEAMMCCETYFHLDSADFRVKPLDSCDEIIFDPDSDLEIQDIFNKPQGQISKKVNLFNLTDLVGHTQQNKKISELINEERRTCSPFLFFIQKVAEERSSVDNVGTYEPA